jgi:hypothetical protein
MANLGTVGTSGDTGNLAYTRYVLPSAALGDIIGAYLAYGYVYVG